VGERKSSDVASQNVVVENVIVPEESIDGNQRKKDRPTNALLVVAFATGLKFMKIPPHSLEAPDTTMLVEIYHVTKCESRHAKVGSAVQGNHRTKRGADRP